MVVHAAPIIAIHKLAITISPTWKRRAPAEAGARLMVRSERVWAWEESDGKQVVWCDVSFDVGNPSRRSTINLNRFYVMLGKHQKLAAGPGWIRNSDGATDVEINEVVGEDSHSKPHQMTFSGWSPSSRKPLKLRLVVEGTAGLVTLKDRVAAKWYRATAPENASSRADFDPMDVHHFELRELPDNRAEVSLIVHLNDESAMTHDPMVWDEALAIFQKLYPVFGNAIPPVVGRDKYGIIGIVQIHQGDTLRRMFLQRLRPPAAGVA